MRKFFQEFRKFISRGNVVDLAVGVIIGSAFTAIVTALSNNILKPIINWVLSLVLGSNSLDNVYTYLKKVEMIDATTGATTIDLANSIYIDWGSFINAIINFLLIAIVVFVIVKLINKAKEMTDINEIMTTKVQEKLDKDEELTAAEAKWLARYAKRHPDKAPKKAEVVEPAPVKEPEPSSTDKLLMEILAQLKENNQQG